MIQKEKPKELFRVPYTADIDTTSGMTPFHEESHSERGYIHVKACTLEEAQTLAFEQLDSKYGKPWKLGVGEASIANFADIWRDQTSEELFDKHIIQPRGHELGLYQRRAAARLLARRVYEPAGEVLLGWLTNPNLGIGGYTYGIEYEHAGIGEPLGTDDAEPRDILLLATESLGLMRYKPAREDLEKLAKDERIRRTDPRLSLCFSIASQRLDGFTTYADKGSELEHDILLFIAATSPKEFFRSRVFKGLVSQVIFDDFDYWYASSQKLAERYIEALRRVPDLKIPVISEHPYPQINLTSFLARQGMTLDIRGRNLDIEHLERICAEILDITRGGEGLHVGSNVHLGITLFDGTTAWVNDGLERRVKEYLKQNCPLSIEVD